MSENNIGKCNKANVGIYPLLTCIITVMMIIKAIYMPLGQQNYLWKFFFFRALIN